MRTKKVTTTDQTTQKETTENRWDRGLIILACFLLFVGCILTTASLVQGASRNKRIAHIDHVVTEAKDASKAAQKAVNDAVAPSQTPEGKAQARRFLKALDSIDNIETKVQIIETLLQKGR